MGSSSCIEVTSRSRADIRALATSLRQVCQVGDEHFPIMPFIELVLPQLMPGFELQVEDKRDMGDNHGMTYPDENIIVLREDVYGRAQRGMGRDRFTAAHELGHLLLHRGMQGFSRRLSADVPPYRSSEWQADQFAAELLMPVGAARAAADASALAEACGVTFQAAETRWRKLHEEGLICK